jgi:hypothetical protein
LYNSYFGGIQTFDNHPILLPPLGISLILNLWMNPYCSNSVKAAFHAIRLESDKLITEMSHAYEWEKEHECRKIEIDIWNHPI